MHSSPAIRVVIADDHPLMRAALKETLRARIEGVEIAEASSLASLQDLLGATPDIDVILLDLRMPDSNGFSALVKLRTRFPEIPVIVVSAIEDDEAVNRAIVLGASGYIAKSAPVDTVGKTLLDVLAGQIVRPPGRSLETTTTSEDVNQFRKLRTLTPQQFNVLVMMAEGYSNKMVSSHMQISESTVKAHITAILVKLGLQRRTQAALLAQRALQMETLRSGEVAAPG